MIQEDIYPEIETLGKVVCDFGQAKKQSGLQNLNHDDNEISNYPAPKESFMTEKIRNINKTLLSDNWYTLNKYSFEYQKTNGDWERQEREAYDRGNGSTILLYNSTKGTVILTRQFRLPTYVNGNKDGMLIETCAGLLDENNAEDCIKKEAEEETGYKIDKVKKIFQSYMSPGSVTEILYFFIAEYSDAMKVSEGGGLEHEQENIQVLELNFNDAYGMIESGEIMDGKTIMLLQYAKLNNLFA